MSDTSPVEKMRAALKKSAQGWVNVIELGLLPERHRETAIVLRDEAYAALEAAAPSSPAMAVERKEGKLSMTEAQIKHMVDRFLNWKLPADFNPDCGIHFDADAAKKLNPCNARYEPVGTNLLTATDATAMVRHMIEALPLSSPAMAVRREVLEGVQPIEAWAVVLDFKSYDTDPPRRICPDSLSPRNIYQTELGAKQAGNGREVVKVSITPISASPHPIGPDPVGEGVVVPRKPTEAMVEAARMTLPGPVDICDADIEDIYVTMLDAAPVSPVMAVDRREVLEAAAIEWATARWGYMNTGHAGGRYAKAESALVTAINAFEAASPHPIGPYPVGEGVE